MRLRRNGDTVLAAELSSEALRPWSRRGSIVQSTLHVLHHLTLARREVVYLLSVTVRWAHAYTA
jgi:hypothetical protein